MPILQCSHTHFYWPFSADTQHLWHHYFAASYLSIYNISFSQALYSIAHEHVRSYYNFSVLVCRVHLWPVSDCKKRYLIYSAVPCMYSESYRFSFLTNGPLHHTHSFSTAGTARGDREMWWFFVGWRTFNGIFNRAVTAKSLLVLTTHTCRGTDSTFRG